VEHSAKAAHYSISAAVGARKWKAEGVSLCRLLDYFPRRVRDKLRESFAIDLIRKGLNHLEVFRRGGRL